MDKPEDSPELYLSIIRAEIDRLGAKERNSKHKDGFRLPSHVYEILTDLGALDSLLAGMKTLWHRDSEDYRKASMHLSKLAWDLRKKLHEYL